MPWARTADIEVLFKPIKLCAGGGLTAGIWLPKTVRPELDVILALHGGGFTMGSHEDVPKTDFDYYNKEGFVVVSAQYRLLPHVRAPEIVDDVVDAYKWIFEELKNHVSGASSVRSVIVTGWSAGATLTCQLAYYAPKRGLKPPAAIIVSYGLFDPDNMRTTPYDEVMAALPEEKRAFAMKIFDEPATGGVRHPPASKEGPAPQIPLANTPRLAWLLPLIRGGGLQSYLYDSAHPPFNKAYAPIRLLEASEAWPPTFVMIAGADKLIPVTQSEAFIEVLKKKNVDFATATATDMPHGKSENWDEEVDTGYPGWWKEAIEPSIKWAIAKCRE